MNRDRGSAFDFGTNHDDLEDASFDRALEYSFLNYLCKQLCWSIPAARERVTVERERRIPRQILASLEHGGWSLTGQSVLDVGCGHGAMVHELLTRGAHAIGIEPSREFSRLARRRITDAGYSAGRILRGDGACLPFADDSFDYAVSLQVLEHVPDPERILSEIFRVLKPGGQLFLSCENYLSFREQHYRVAWFPLLPRPAAEAYLRLRGRDPEFFRRHVHYTTYFSVRRTAVSVGFRDLTEQRVLAKLADPSRIRRTRVRHAVGLVSGTLGSEAARMLCAAFLTTKNAFRVGVNLLLEKPGRKWKREKYAEETDDTGGGAVDSPRAR